MERGNAYIQRRPGAPKIPLKEEGNVYTMPLAFCRPEGRCEQVLDVAPVHEVDGRHITDSHLV
eukprot:10235713-Alexandrium_andersonii.AAC.1